MLQEKHNLASLMFCLKVWYYANRGHLKKIMDLIIQPGRTQLRSALLSSCSKHENRKPVFILYNNLLLLANSNATIKTNEYCAVLVSMWEWANDFQRCKKPHLTFMYVWADVYTCSLVWNDSKKRPSGKDKCLQALSTLVCSLSVMSLSYEYSWGNKVESYSKDNATECRLFPPGYIQYIPIYCFGVCLWKQFIYLYYVICQVSLVVLLPCVLH